jgi:hypothetical protein
MKNAMASKIAFWLSVVLVVLSAVVSLGNLQLWLAGTQWMLIAIVLGVWALFLKE